MKQAEKLAHMRDLIYISDESLKRAKEDANENGWLGIIAVSALIIISIMFGIRSLDNVDIDDSLAPYLCEAHNATFVSETHSFDGVRLTDLKIVCEKRLTPKLINDSYLYIRYG